MKKEKQNKMSSKYARAYTEVLEIIKYFPKNEYNKIPKERIEYYKNNKDNNYNFEINPKIDLLKQNVSKEAGAIIVMLFKEYFATDLQKEKLEELLKLNEKKLEIEKREKFNPDDIFKNKEKESNKKEINANLPIEIKNDSFFKRMLNYIKNLSIKNIK